MNEINNLSADELLNQLPQFNKTGKIFKELIGDPERPELLPISNINDINKGSIYNSVEWHIRFQRLAQKSAVLNQAEGYFLEKWAELLGVERPPGLSDEEFIGYIIGYVLSGHTTLPMAFQVINTPGIWLLHARDVGFAADVSATDVGIIEPSGIYSLSPCGIIFPDRMGVFMITDDLNKITPLLIEKILRMVVAGSAIFVGEIEDVI